MAAEPVTVWARLAQHEAGHAVAAVLLGVEVGAVRLHRDRGYGETLTRPGGDPYTDATIQMAGWAVTPLGVGAAYDVRAAVALVGRERTYDAADAARVLLHNGRHPALAAVADALLAAGELAGAEVTALVSATRR